MFNPCPKPSHKPSKTKYDPIPKQVRLEVYNRDNGCCVKCGRPVPLYLNYPPHHITYRSHRYEPMVRNWFKTEGGWDWRMVPVWFGFHSKENLVTVCPCCEPHGNEEERYFWEKWRDMKYYIGGSSQQRK